MIGPRNDHVCANITTSQGYRLLWTNKIRYLGIYIAKSRQFGCFTDHAKKSFFRSANATFGKIDRTASEEVTLELLRTKCILVFLFITKKWFEIVRLCCHPFSLFRTLNTEIIAECQHYFGFSLPSKLIERKRNKFINNYNNVSLF